jgi:hypothetical protein
MAKRQLKSLASGFGAGFGLAFIISYTMTGEIMAKDVSSPQTTELNAKTRAPTLMKYVHIGQVESLAVIGVAAYCDKTYRMPILVGGLAGVAVNEVLYQYAKQQGIANPGPPTEQHNSREDREEGGFVYG